MLKKGVQAEPWEKKNNVFYHPDSVFDVKKLLRKLLPTMHILKMRKQFMPQKIAHIGSFYI